MIEAYIIINDLELIFNYFINYPVTFNFLMYYFLLYIFIVYTEIFLKHYLCMYFFKLLLSYSF